MAKKTTKTKSKTRVVVTPEFVASTRGPRRTMAALAEEVRQLEILEKIQKEIIDAAQAALCDEPRGIGSPKDRTIWRIGQAAQCLENDEPQRAAGRARAYLAGDSDSDFEYHVAEVTEPGSALPGDEWAQVRGSLLFVKLAYAPRKDLAHRALREADHFKATADVVVDLSTGLVKKNRWGALPNGATAAEAVEPPMSLNDAQDLLNEVHQACTRVLKSYERGRYPENLAIEVLGMVGNLYRDPAKKINIDGTPMYRLYDGTTLAARVSEAIALLEG